MMDLSHFIEANGIVFTGFHLFVDLYGVRVDVAEVHEKFKQSVIDCGATILSDNFHIFGENEGISGALILAESHASYHSWFEADGLFVCDFFTCGDANPLNALAGLKSRFAPRTAKIKVMMRGEFCQKPSKLFFVYTLIDPRTELPFYVGKGSGHRLQQTTKSKYTKKNPEKRQILLELESENLKPIVTINSNHVPESVALLIESYIIDFYGKKSNGGILTNYLDLQHPVAREKIQETMKRYHAEMSDADKKKLRKKISKGLANENPEAKKERYRRRSSNLEYRKKLSVAVQNRDKSFMTEEWKRKQAINRSKTYMVYSPEGEVQEVSNLLQFCRERPHLNYSSMIGTAKGRQSHHKGWRAESSADDDELKDRT